MRKTNVILWCLLLGTGLAMSRGISAQVTKADYQRIDTLANISKSVYNAGIKPSWIGESHSFWYLNHEREGDFFYLVDATTGKKTNAFNQEKLAVALAKLSGKEVKASRLPFSKISYTPDRNGFSFEFDGSGWDYQIKSNKLVKAAPVENTDRKRIRRDNRGGERVTSPDGLWEAYAKDNNLYVFNLKDKKEVALSMDGMKGLYYSSDIRWSPDSKKIAVTKIRDVEERRIPLLESSPAGQKQPVLQWRDYAKPGDVVPVSTPALFDVVAQKQIALETTPYENQFTLYLTGWRADSRAFTFEFNQRGHQRYEVVEVNGETGVMRPLVDERVKTFIHYNWNYRYDLNDGAQMLWISERDGWRHLYMMDGGTGEVKHQITKGEWVVRDVEYVDEKNGTILFKASGFNPGEDPYHVHYCRIGFDGSGFVDLTKENGNHVAVFSADKAYFTDVYSRPDMPHVSVVRRSSDGSVVAELQRSDVSSLAARGWQMPEVFSAKGRDGQTDIWGTILRPAGFDALKSYPVIEFIYAGPHDSHVGKDFSPYHHLASRLSDLGFVVVMIDGMGTANRSKAFHDVCWKNLKDAGFPDRIAWIKAAAKKYPYMDAERVGIYGWSAGGQNALGALLFHGDFYKVAAAMCGCHDNRMDKIWWNEQWMGYPIDASYRESSNVDNAWRLKGKLLLMNGELDDNVDPASSLQVADALIKANKNFEQLYLPGHTHSLGGAYEMHRIHDFFVKNLLNQTPPDWE